MKRVWVTMRVIDRGGRPGSCGGVSPRTVIVEEMGKPKYLTLNGHKVDKFELLALAKKMSWDSPKRARELLQFISTVFRFTDDWVFDELYLAVAWRVAQSTAYHNSEYWLHGHFKENVKAILGERVEIVDGPKHQRHVPDAWVTIDGKLYPVEIKNRKFNKAALNQLKRYMKVFGVDQGIAIAEELATELPPNIMFVSCADWRAQS